MNKECLQRKIGSCKGCDIYQMAKDKINGNSNNITIVSQRMQKTYCPEGEIMQPIELVKQSTW